MTRRIGFMLAAMLVVAATQLCRAQSVVVVHDSAGSLDDRFRRAHAGARHAGGGFWIGYSIERLMEANSYIGSRHSDPERNRPTLEELIFGVSKEETGRGTERMVMKDVGILVHYASAGGELDDLEVSNLSLHADLNAETLYWIGSAGQGESLSLLGAAFRAASTARAKECIVTAVGFHEPSEAVTRFLASVIGGDEPSSVRTEAAFWLGQTDREDALELLTGAARRDRSGELREQAVFAVSEMTGEAAVDSLIALARTAGGHDVRDRAIFWLGQKASRKATAALSGIVEDEENGETEVQKSALYALSQMPGDGGLDMLIRVARSHRNPQVRKAAIMLLGQSEDARAIDALVDIVRN